MSLGRLGFVPGWPSMTRFTRCGRGFGIYFFKKRSPGFRWVVDWATPRRRFDQVPPWPWIRHPRLANRPSFSVGCGLSTSDSKFDKALVGRGLGIPRFEIAQGFPGPWIWHLVLNETPSVCRPRIRHPRSDIHQGFAGHGLGTLASTIPSGFCGRGLDTPVLTIIGLSLAVDAARLENSPRLRFRGPRLDTPARSHHQASAGRGLGTHRLD
ncbi:hypothetical protein B0T16DRAFT_198990 [Cercophora newfieldiana]|uniref:Uncharacterized protein n=1 Tax=Cercophora newfieldiana TaxID=92897 RepID=A0AA39Y2L1_9PEZI|nr:hypothetical protein B0T16DRAFT_198990 [Cercophora newfieldiana]